MRALRKLFVKAAIVEAMLAAPIGLSAGIANADSVNWEAIAQCESGGNWSANTGNGHYGGLQFSQATWNANGGVGSPANANRQQQVQVANRVLSTQGIGAWPKCGSSHSTGPSPKTSMAPTDQLRNTVNQIISIFLPRR